MRCSMIDDIWTVTHKKKIHFFCIADRSNFCMQIQFPPILTNQLLLNVVCIIFVNINNDQSFWILSGNLTA